MKKQEINEIVKEKSNQTNSKLLDTLSFLSEKHETTKESIIKLSYELDDIEESYITLLDEYKKRTKNKP